MAVGFIIKGEGASKNRQRILTEGERQREREKNILQWKRQRRRLRRRISSLLTKKMIPKRRSVILLPGLNRSLPLSLSLYIYI